MSPGWGSANIGGVTAIETRWIELARFVRRSAADELVLVLQSVGISTDVKLTTASNGVTVRWWVVLVSAAQIDRAREILAEEQPGDQVTAADVATPPGSRPGLHWVIALMVVNICVWIALEGTGGSETRANLIRFGASHAPSILAGEWWRPVTATFLHIGARHLLGNMISLALFGALALGQWDVGRFYLIYVLSGVSGNLTSLAVSPTGGAKAGASGSILGLLGALAGRRLRAIRRARRVGDTAVGPPSRFKTWHVVAMLVAFYGFVVGSSGRADHLAHVGGIVTGLLLGLLLPPPGSLPASRDRRLSLACGGIALSLVVLAVACGGWSAWQATK